MAGFERGGPPCGGLPLAEAKAKAESEPGIWTGVPFPKQEKSPPFSGFFFLNKKPDGFQARFREEKDGLHGRFGKIPPG